METRTLQSASPSPSKGKTAFLRLGTRGSPLAMVQAELTRDLLAKAHGINPADIEIQAISTAGDRSQGSNVPMSDIGGKGLFSKEIEARLSTGDIDLAVHSSKDMASVLPEGLDMPVFLEREDIRDAFISFKADSPQTLPENAVLGSSSIRRRAQMLRVRPDLRIVEFRGNVGTRLQKLADGVADATLLAAAGLIRSGQQDRATSFLDVSQFPPAPAQGAIGIEIRSNDNRTRDLLSPLNHAATATTIAAERSFLKALDGSCRTPIAAWSKLDGGTITLFGQILSLDGSEVHEGELTGPAGNAAELGLDLGNQLRAAAGDAFFAALMEG